MTRRVLSLAAAAALLSSCGLAVAGKFTRGIDVGDAAVAWKDLEGADGERHGLEHLKEAKLVVVAFTCNHCPVAQAYEDRFADFAKTYKEKGAEFIAINSDPDEATRPEALKERAEEKGFPFPYLADPTQEVARGFRAMVTPHVYVLDGDRKIAYMGAFDDSMDPDKVKHHYARDAVDALLDGRAPEVAETKQFGCGIQYNK